MSIAVPGPVILVSKHTDCGSSRCPLCGPVSQACDPSRRQARDPSPNTEMLTTPKNEPVSQGTESGNRLFSIYILAHWLKHWLTGLMTHPGPMMFRPLYSFMTAGQLVGMEKVSMNLTGGRGGTSLPYSIWTQAFLVKGDKPLKLIFKQINTAFAGGFGC